MTKRPDFVENVLQYILVGSSVAGQYILAEVEELGVKETVGRILSTSNSRSPFAFISLLYAWLSQMESVSMQATELLEEMLAIYESGKSASKAQKAARLFFRFEISVENRHSGNFQEHMLIEETVKRWMELLKAHLDKPETFHAVVRWLKAASSSNRSMLTTVLAISNHTLDPRAEVLVESLVGPVYWKFLTVITNPENWKGGLPAAELTLPNNFDPSQATFGQLEQKLAEMGPLLNGHNVPLAESVDKAVHASGCELKDAGETWDSMMQLVAGDVVSVVSPLRQSWMKLERKAWEFLSAEFPLVEIAALPNAEASKGAECRFRLYSSEDSKRVIVGSMDTEGKIAFADIAAFTPLTRLALQAVVVQSLAAVMVPRHIETLAKSVGKGPALLWEGEVFASRPVIHVVGVLGKEDDEDGPTIDTARRLHPEIAKLLFQWLLDEEPDWDPQLYQMCSEELQGGKEEFFFAPWLQAKNLLKAKKVALSQVFHNTVRAHTRPVAVYMDRAGSIVVRQVTERALRNYGRFLHHGGRQLDQRPVRKTYELPNGGRLVLEVARTFNQGTFNSLEQVWDVIPDSSLKARAKAQFKF